MRLLMSLMCVLTIASGADVTATRFAENPLITVQTPTLGDNVNGPSIIRVPDWVEKPLGRYYMYFAHHSGTYIRLAYADSLHGPWKVYEPGVLNVSETAFFRPQPDPYPHPYGVYTHVASPEIYVDNARKKIVMWVHGQFTDGKRWPADVREAGTWLRQNGYSQVTQVTESGDGMHFTALPAITKDPYLRVFPYGGMYYGIVRLGRLVRSTDPLKTFEQGPDPFAGTPYSGKVRHVALLPKGDTLHVFLSVIGMAPEKIVHTTIPLAGDWMTWKVQGFDDVLLPSANYECPDYPTAASEVGEIYGPAKQLRDPASFEEGGKLYLFYTICGEQGIAGAEVVLK